MIKKILHSITKLSLISGLTIITSLSSSIKTLALPTEQIVKTLHIPVFAVLDEQGQPLVGQVEDKDKDKKQFATYIFISQKDANEFFAQLKKTNPDLVKKRQVTFLPLDTVYQAQISQAKPNEVLFLYRPEQKEVEEAKKISSQTGQEYKGGVPLFVVRGVNKDQGYLTIKQKDQEVIPLFFELHQLELLLEQVKKNKPELAANLKIEVIPLEGFIASMKNSNDPIFGKFILVPSQETIKAVQAAQAKSNLQSNPNNGLQSNPQTNPSNDLQLNPQASPSPSN